MAHLAVYKFDHITLYQMKSIHVDVLLYVWYILDCKKTISLNSWLIVMSKSSGLHIDVDMMMWSHILSPDTVATDKLLKQNA